MRPGWLRLVAMILIMVTMGGLGGYAAGTALRVIL